MYIYGASGHAKVVIDILEACGKKIDALIDDNPVTTHLYGYPVSNQSSPGKTDEVIIAIGNGNTRRRVARNLNCRFATAIHPSAIISPKATVGEGSAVMQGAVVQAGANIGRHCIINTRASVDHECQIGDYVHIAPGCTLSGNVTVGDGTWIGVGSTVIQGITIGKNCYIGAGSVVVKDIPDNSKAYGVPCRIIDTIQPSE